MGIFKRRSREKPIENRAEEGMITGEEALIKALIGTTEMNKETAMQIPAVASCIERIGDAVAALPIKLYHVVEDGVEEITDDDRLFLLNHDTRDSLTANQFIKSMIEDYFLGKGTYAYIEKSGTRFKKLHYIDEKYVQVTESVDPIDKTNTFLIKGEEYKSFELLKCLRNTKNGGKGKSIIEQNKLALSLVYASLSYENSMFKKGGNRKGFLTVKKKLEGDAFKELKDSFENLYSNNNEEKIVVLNEGTEFKESSNTAVEMQLKENKEANTKFICMLFKVPVNLIYGTATEQDEKNFVKQAIMPVINEFESSLDRDLLTEKEKEEGYYFAFDTKELTRGSIKERYEAYEIGLNKNFLQIDEVRKQEDLPELGFKWITLGLQNVLLNPETMEIYTPNTGRWQALNDSQIQTLKGGEKNEN